MKGKFDPVIAMFVAVVACWLLGIGLAATNSINLTAVPGDILGALYWVPCVAYLGFCFIATIGCAMGYDLDRPTGKNKR